MRCFHNIGGNLMIGKYVVVVVVAVAVAIIWFLSRRRTSAREVRMMEKIEKLVHAKLLETDTTLAEWAEYDYSELMSLLHGTKNQSVYAFGLTEDEYERAVMIIRMAPHDLAERIYIDGEEWTRAVLKDDVCGYGKTIDWITKLYDQTAEYDEDQEFRYCEGRLYPYIRSEEIS